jgi:hypothetical protein
MREREMSPRAESKKLQEEQSFHLSLYISSHLSEAIILQGENMKKHLTIVIKLGN